MIPDSGPSQHAVTVDWLELYLRSRYGEQHKAEGDDPLFLRESTQAGGTEVLPQNL